MRISSTLSVAAAAALGLTTAGCITAHDCQATGCGTSRDCLVMGGSAETAFPCPGYGPANRCATATGSNPNCRGVANMQPGATHVQPNRAPPGSVNHVLPYSTDDNNPNLFYRSGGDRTEPSGLGGSTPATPQP